MVMISATPRPIYIVDPSLISYAGPRGPNLQISQGSDIFPPKTQMLQIVITPCLS
jgi:hypothetical protein